jgi:WD40 repeat protein
MLWIKKLKNFFALLLEPDIVNDFIDDGEDFYTINTEKIFTECSVKGDFRLHLIKDGFIACWRDFLVCRDHEGQVLWKLEGWGRSMAVNSDQSKFVAVSAKRFCVFDTKTGMAISETVKTNSFVDFVVWIDKDRFITTDSKKLYLYDSACNELEVFEGAISDDGFIGGVVPDLFNSDLVFILDVNNQKVKIIDLRQRRVIKEKTAGHAEQIIYDPNNSWVWLTIVNGTKLEEVKIYERKNLIECYAFSFDGKSGVRFANQMPKDMSFHSFVSLPSLSPNRRYFLVNDNSGLLWLLDARTGDKRRVFKRNLLDYVFSTVWLDDEYFIAMLEDGYVAKMSIRGTKLIFKKSDFELENCIED